jgi:hypothetical protein
MPRVGINRAEISFSGRLGLSQTKLRINSQLFINKFTTVLDDLVHLLLLPEFSTALVLFSPSKTCQCHSYIHQYKYNEKNKNTECL